jgi:hypothetical protein
MEITSDIAQKIAKNMVGQTIVMHIFQQKDESGRRTVVFGFRTKAEDGQLTEIQCIISGAIESFDESLPSGRQSSTIDDCQPGSAVEGTFLGMIAGERGVRFEWEDLNGCKGYNRVLPSKAGKITISFSSDPHIVPAEEAA